MMHSWTGSSLRVQPVRRVKKVRKPDMLTVEGFLDWVFADPKTEAEKIDWVLRMVKGT